MFLLKLFKGRVTSLLFACILFQQGVAQGPSVSVQDSLVLIDLYNSTDGPHWSYMWDLNKRITTWSGVQLVQSGLQFKIIGLSMANFNMTGQLPASIGNLQDLTTISFWRNNLYGNIPASLGGLPLLYSLDLTTNKFSGTVPAALGNITSLKYLNLADNVLSGGIPASMGNLSNLLFLTLDHNLFNFDGLEEVFPRLPNTVKNFWPQADLIVHKSKGVLSVTAGGTESNNSYYWRNTDTFKDTTVVGDSTFAPKEPGTYYLTVYNSVLGPNHPLFSGAVPVKKIVVYKLAPMPVFMDAAGYINTSAPNLPLVNNVKGVATDGVSKVILLVPSDVPLTFSVSSQAKGSFSSLSDQDVQQTGITVAPVSGRVAVLYNAPDGYGTEDQTYREAAQILVSNAYDDQAVAVMQLMTPPVVLVHGMWSSPDAWTDGKFIDRLKQRGITNIQTADYADHNYMTFSPVDAESIYGRIAVQSATVSGLLKYQMDSIVATQVDVVGHSLGGLMSRSFSQQPEFKTISNYKKGYFHKLITIGTPHRGSPLGPLLWNNREKIIYIHTSFFPYVIPVKLAAVLKLAGMTIGSVHRDFAINSAGIVALAQTPPFKTYAITANYFPTQALDYAALSGVTSLLFKTSLDEVFASRCDNNTVLPTDVIVPLSSQRGYINSDTLFLGVSHAKVVPLGTTETTNPSIQAKVADLLLTQDAARFSSGFPAPSAQPLDCNTAVNKTATARLGSVASPAVLKGNANPDNKYVEITSPASGSSFDQNSGASVRFSFQPGNGLAPVAGSFIVAGVGIFPVTDIGTHEVSVNLPADIAAGRHTVVLLCEDAVGNVYADTSMIKVKPVGQLDSILAVPSPVYLDSAVRQQQLTIYGFYSNAGVVRQESIGSALDGTLYVAKKGNAVVKVSADGLVNAMAPGTDTLIVTHNGFTVKVPVVVVANFQFVQINANVIDFPAIDNKSAGDAPFGVDASASSGEAVSFSIISGPASIENGIITLTGAGTVMVQATSTGNAYFANAQPVIRSFSISGALPVKLVNFKAQRTSSSQVVLSWDTETEQNNKGFVIERKLPDAPDFVKVGFVQAVTANGNSSTVQHYRFNDANNYTGVTYYRLQQVDLDNRSEYSATRSVEGVQGGLEMISLKPNPARSGAYLHAVDMKGIKEAVLTDMRGSVVRRMKVQAGQYIDLSGVPSGTYIITVYDAFVKGSHERVKVVVAR